MFNILKSKNPTFTVEEIHAEFDFAEERILEQCSKLLSELNIPTETQLERKASLLKELGFTNSEPVKQAALVTARNVEVKRSIDLTQSQIDTINELKVKYPLEKFITVKELERICSKFNLIHAPVSNYIKDIPEKNVLEMSRAKPLSKDDKEPDSRKLIGLESNYLLELFDKKEPIFTVEDLKRIDYSFDSLVAWFKNNDTTWAYVAVLYGLKDGKKGLHDNTRGRHYYFRKSEVITKDGLFIAAPPSHFNLDGLTKKSTFGFFKVEQQEVKDPVVFQYCKNNICRIITKWGTDDDQSYLDPALTNESQN